MPLRGLFYFARLYAGYVEKNNLDIYANSLLSLPTPRYIVFYNGLTQVEDQMHLRLSASFDRQKAGDSCLECIATVININQGHNKKLMEQCRKLYEYAYLVAQIRKSLHSGMTLTTSIDSAVKDCIDNGILKEFLLKHRAEVRFMILSEYNEKLHLETTYNLGKADGISEGISRMSTLNQILIDKNRIDDLKRASMDSTYQKQLFEEFNL
jgi:hypothetical protein